jgi:hypothetical protein
MFKKLLICAGLIWMVGCSNPMFGNVKGKCEYYSSCNGSPRTLEKTIPATKCECDEGEVQTANCTITTEWSSY